ncbi:MAG TPA: acetyl-CoA hydrolase/transferase family protein [Clostridiales bacterium]|nr:acetyl-CoA hydrolase/transferase family protein [Clostridiales bacterium]
MSWQDEYNKKLCTAEEAVRHIQSGDTVVFAHCVGEPPALVDAMVANAAQYEDVEIKHMVSLSRGTYTAPELEKNFRVNPMFAGASVREALASGRGDFTPVFFHEIPKLFREGRLKCDVLLAQVSLPNENGEFSLGTSVDYTWQAMKSARTVIVQVNKHMPFTFGTLVKVEDFDHIVEADMPLYQLQPPRITEVEEQIGRYCASLVEDGSTLQLGIGGIPDAVMLFLTDKKDLGIHSEMISDGTLALYEKGVITGRKKNFDQGKMSVTFLMGTQKLYDFVHKNLAVELRPVDYINHPAVIMKQHKMVSINSAIEVDLQGQVNAEAMGLRQFSGVGGQVDFVRGAAMGDDGKAIIAMPSVTVKKDGTMISKIVAFLNQGAPVTTSRNDIDYVVTENGIAELKGKSLRERARNLIEIAHPSTQDELMAEFERRFCQKY